MSVELLRPFKLVYVASPYSGYAEGIDAAYEEVADLTGQLIKEGIPAISPIAHSHAVCECAGLDHYDHDLWLKMDAPLMEACDAICVVEMAGWAVSKGVRIELAAFANAEKPAFILNPNTFVCERLFPMEWSHA